MKTTGPVLLVLAGLSCVCFCEDYFLDAKTSPSPVATTNTGSIRGRTVRTPNGCVSVFLGIPYAKPPTGGNRFKKTVPVRKWAGTYDATSKSPPCLQMSSKDFPWIAKEKPSEDCLYLNIWVPGIVQEETRKLPVMVWIHGGAFSYGSGSMDIYDGTMLADIGNVIVVTFNYRLGVFGFLDAGTEDAPGNMGLHDQVTALKWIKDNVVHFGGDPDSITLFGESAGSISAGLHLISPLSRDLFRRAIMQSGGPYHPLLGLPPLFSRLKGSQFASSVQCSNDTTNLVSDPKSVLECLRKIDAWKLAKADSITLETQPFSFLPTAGNEFMPVPPIEAIEAGSLHSGELLIGGTKDEGSILLNYMMPEVFDKFVSPQLNIPTGRMLISALFQNSTFPDPEVIADFYLRDVHPDDSRAIVKAVYDSFGDFVLFCPTLLLAEKAKGSVSFYYFTHRPSNSKVGDWMGTAHFDDVPFVFGEPIRMPLAYTAEEERFSRNLIQKWTNFARYGTPVPAKSGENWPKFTESNQQYLELNPRSSAVGKDLRREECNFWKSAFNPRQ